VESTGDESLLHEGGDEVLVETARLWRDLGFFSTRKGGAFCICGVTGPDEYNTVVNNNLFTNMMARENLLYAAERALRLENESPERFERLCARVRLGPDEVSSWREAAEKMMIPVDEIRGIHLQDDAFMDKKPWDFEGTPPDRYPLLLHYHPLVIYRHRVIKQADVVLAMLLLSRAFTAEEKRHNFDYYDAVTTGDSSLSVCVQSVLAAETGRIEQALEYAGYAAWMDLSDIGGNVKDGCHIASMGGTWLCLVYGFGGFREHRGLFSFHPRIPDEVARLRFMLSLRGSRLEVEMADGRARYRLVEGDEAVLLHEDEEVVLTSSHPEETRAISGTTPL
jgi:alpha,alpha-trehalose phosphorylase